MAIRAELLGDGHLHTALARRNLAVVLEARGEGPTAAVLRQRASAIRLTEEGAADVERVAGWEPSTN